MRVEREPKPSAHFQLLLKQHFEKHFPPLLHEADFISSFIGIVYNASSGFTKSKKWFSGNRDPHFIVWQGSSLFLKKVLLLWGTVPLWGATLFSWILASNVKGSPNKVEQDFTSNLRDYIFSTTLSSCILDTTGVSKRFGRRATSSLLTLCQGLEKMTYISNLNELTYKIV